VKEFFSFFFFYFYFYFYFLSPPYLRDWTAPNAKKFYALIKYLPPELSVEKFKFTAHSSLSLYFRAFSCPFLVKI